MTQQREPAPRGAPDRPQRKRERVSDAATSPTVLPGQLIENVPRRMRVGISSPVEVRIAKAEVKAISDGLDLNTTHRHDIQVTKAMSVRLRAPEGGFFIETASPETQWIENALGLMADDYARWRWTVTPKLRGKRKLQLIVSARTLGPDGLAAETALPDQIIEIKVSTNYAVVAKRTAGWAVAAVLGGLLAQFGGQMFTECFEYYCTHDKSIARSVSANDPDRNILETLANSSIADKGRHIPLALRLTVMSMEQLREMSKDLNRELKYTGKTDLAEQLAAIPGAAVLLSMQYKVDDLFILNPLKTEPENTLREWQFLKAYAELLISREIPSALAE